MVKLHKNCKNVKIFAIFFIFQDSYFLVKNHFKNYGKKTIKIVYFLAFFHIKKLWKNLKNIVTNRVICLSIFSALCYTIPVRLYIYINRLIFWKNFTKKNKLAETKIKQVLGEIMSFGKIGILLSKMFTAVQSIEPTGSGLVIFEKLGWVLIWIWEGICLGIYNIIRWLLALVDFMQYFVQKLIGLDYWLNRNYYTLEGAIESDLIFGFLYNDTIFGEVIDCFKGKMRKYQSNCKTWVCEHGKRPSSFGADRLYP